MPIGARSKLYLDLVGDGLDSINVLSLEAPINDLI
jgi:aryl carrier-like protein